MTEPPEDQEGATVHLVWEVEDETVQFANRFLIQHQPNEFVLTVGQLVLPPVLGTPEERAAQIRKIEYLPIRVLGRYGFTRDRLVELIDILQENLQKHDARTEQPE